MKSKAKVLVCDPVHKKGIEKLRNAGLEVYLNPTISHGQLRKVVQNYDALIVRASKDYLRESLVYSKKIPRSP